MIKQTDMKRLFLFSSLLFSAALFAQDKISVPLSFPAGAKLEVVTTVNGTSSSGMGETSFNTTVTRALDVERVSDSGAVIEHKIKRLLMNMESPMFSQKYDSENPQDQKSEIGKNLTYLIDPSGMISSVRVDEKENKKKTVGQADMFVDMMNSMSGGVEGFGIPKAGEPTEFRILPKTPVGKGDTWTVEHNGRKTTYTVTDLTDSEILLSFVLENKSDRTQEMMGMTVDVKGTEKGTGTATLDRKTGILKQSTSNIDGTATVSAMGQAQEVSSKVTKTMVVKW
jgi:hypothetical protein